MQTVAASSIQNVVETARFSELRAVLRDNSGQTSMLAKATAFHALPARSPNLDIKA